MFSPTVTCSNVRATETLLQYRENQMGTVHSFLESNNNYYFNLYLKHKFKSPNQDLEVS